MRKNSWSALMLAFGLLIPTPAFADVLSASAETIAGAKFDPIIPGPNAPLGVSPEVYYEEESKTFYLYTTSNPGKIYTSKDGLEWSAVSNYRLPNGFDWSIVKMGASDYRLYYSSIMPNETPVVKCTQQKKAFFYATSTDLLNWTSQPGPLVSDIGCGVPHVLKKADGKYLMYHNTITSQHGMHIQTSDDGIKWTALSGIISNNPSLVDPAPIQMPDGTFLMVASTTGDPRSGGLQRLQILSSNDGLTWSHRSSDLYAPAGYSVLDPALKLIDGKLRIWHGYTKGNDHMSSHIATGTLTLQVGKVIQSKPNKVGKTVTCVKGKKQKTIPGSICPPGTKKKKS